MTFRNRLSALAGTGKVIRFCVRGDAEAYAGRIVRVGVDYVEIERLDDDLEITGSACIPFGEVTWLDVDNKSVQRKLLDRCLAITGDDDQEATA